MEERKTKTLIDLAINYSPKACVSILEDLGKYL
jgi:hypothetical protein